MSNFRSRALLDLCYEFDCLLRVDGVCTGGVGEPCHANWSRHGKGLSIKAHDCYAVPGCRACHNWLDQGGADGEHKYAVWTEAFWKYLAMLWNRGLLVVGTEPKTLSDEVARNSRAPLYKKRKSRCTASDKQVKRPAGGFSP